MLGRTSLTAIALLTMALPAHAAPPSPYGAEVAVGLGYAQLRHDSGATLSLHVGGFPVDVLYVGAHVERSPLSGGGANVVGAEVGARYAKRGSPRFTGFITSGVITTGAADETRFLAGLGLRVDVVVGGRLLIGGEARWSIAPEPITRGDSSYRHVITAARALSEADLELIRGLYGYNSRVVVVAPNYADIPACRTTYAGATDDVATCSNYASSASNTTISGFQVDVFGTTYCWFGRGAGYLSHHGSSLCKAGGDPDGSAWARTWFR